MNQEQAYELQQQLKSRDAEVVNLRAALRREQDARAQLRLELNVERQNHRDAIDGFESALVTEQYEKAILEAEAMKLRAERDLARRQLADAQRAIGAAREQLEQPGELEEAK